MDAWLQIAVQVPLVAAFIYFVLQRDKHESEERMQRESRDSKERIERDQQWRQFMAQRDEQWSGVLQSINVSLSVSQAATLRQMEKVELEIKASTLRFDQMERTMTNSLESISDSLETTRPPVSRSRAK